MEISGGLTRGILVRRYKRFLADVECDDGQVITIHCPNTGSMKNCQEPGSRVWFSTSASTTRKYPNTWEVVEVEGRHLVGINTGRANALVTESIEDGTITELSGYGALQREVKYGEQGSRIDLLLSEPTVAAPPTCYVEVKNVSLGAGNGVGLFPDAVTVRGQKHLEELMTVKAAGQRAVLLFCVQHSGIDQVSPADAIDPVYGDLLRRAADEGVEILAYRAGFELEQSVIRLAGSLPVRL